MNPFEQFLTDTVTLRKGDGTEFPGIKAAVSDDKIGIFDVSLHIEPDDILIRTLPNGRTEDLIVEDAVFSQAFHSIPAQWSVTYRRSTQRPKAPHSVNYSVTGPNARINISSHDQSTNIAHSDSRQIFTDIRQVVLDQLGSSPDRDGLLERIGNLEQAQGTPGFLARYQEFVAAAANHMSVLSPFIPALTQLLSGTGS